MEIGKGAYTVDVQDYQSLKEIEDRASDILLCLDSTMDSVTTLTDMYQRLTVAPDGKSGEETLKEDEILFALHEKSRDIGYSRKKVEALLIKAQNTRALVR